MSGLQCSGGVCKASNNSVCNTDTECINGHCENGRCGTLSGSSCPTVGCGSGLTCVSGVCKYDPGTNCSFNQAQCISGTTCDSVSQTCKVPQGGTCTNSSDCTTGNVCETGTCLVNVAGSCTLDSQCISSTMCVNKVCQDPTCTMTSQCQSRFGPAFVCQGDGLCYGNGTCLGMDPNTCTAFPDADCPTTTQGYCKNHTGRQCFSDQECASGVCNQTLSTPVCT